MTNLKILDLSFNKLSGKIPSSFSILAGVDYIYLTGSQLTGAVPDWILENAEYVNATIGDSTYSEDKKPPAASSFIMGGDNWAYSSTGHFLDDGKDSDTYIADNVSVLSTDNAQLYMKARLSPISLTYYGFCLMNGTYIVSLHFAEIMFTGNENYTRLGRRAFHVYIQGRLVWENFNIEIEANGVGKRVIRSFTATVTEGTLEIRLYWAGKGTNAIPTRGVYGPLISAISVYPGFESPQESATPPESTSISAGTVVGIVAALVFVVFLILVILWWRLCLGREDRMAQGSSVRWHHYRSEAAFIQIQPRKS